MSPSYLCLKMRDGHSEKPSRAMTILFSLPQLGII